MLCHVGSDLSPVQATVGSLVCVSSLYQKIKIENLYELSSFFSFFLLAYFIPFYPHFLLQLTPKALLLMCFYTLLICLLVSVFSVFVCLTYINDIISFCSPLFLLSTTF